MSNLENKLKKIVNTFNNINKEEGYRDIKKLSEKYKKNIKVLNVLSQISQKMGDIDTTINSLKKILSIEKNNIDLLTKIYKSLYNAYMCCFQVFHRFAPKCRKV